MDEAVALKDNGNAAFMEGDDAGAARCYTESLQRLEDLEMSDEAKSSQAYRDLKRNVYSNLSNVYLAMQRFDDSCAAATQALRIDPMFVKASLRYVKAKMLGGYPFDAFVYALRHTRALVRAQEPGSTAAKDAAAALQELEGTLSLTLGVSRLSPGFELVDFEGGVDMISRQSYTPGDVIFTEEKYKTTFDEGSINVMSENASSSTTEDIVLRFAKHIRPGQEANSDEWRRFKGDFVGAWPRTADDVDAFTRQHVGAYIRPNFPDLDGDTFDELLLTALMCRYNCFYTGFFRTCALANHSCNANIAMKYNPSTQTVTMTAVKSISPGERMNVKYLNDAYFLLGLCKRRELLRAWLFWCGCPRCLADNDAATAVQEYVGCEHCGQFTHYPIPTPNLAHGTLVDPVLKAIPVCGQCGEDVAWPRAKLDRFYQLTDSPPSSGSGQEAGQWLVAKLTDAKALRLHPAHWIHRVLYYLYCLSLDATLQRRFAAVVQGRPGMASREEEAKDILGAFGLEATYREHLEKIRASPECYDGPGTRALRAAAASAASSVATTNAAYDPAGVVADTTLVRTEAPTHGCDSLRALCILIQLIGPFYPGSEMWAVHRMVCDCVLLHLLYQSAVRLPTEQRLSTEQGLALLQEHGPFLGEAAAHRWLHTYSLLKTSIGKDDERELPPLATLKKAFKQQAPSR